jgi:hypothetical protein
MEKRSICGVVVLFGLLIMGSSTSWADASGFHTRCTTDGPFEMGGFELSIPAPYAPKKQFVEILTLGPGGPSYQAEAQIRHSSWVTATASFEFQGKQFEIEFSTFLSPSLGYGMIDGKEEVFACQLNNQ